MKIALLLLVSCLQICILLTSCSSTDYVAKQQSILDRALITHCYQVTQTKEELLICFRRTSTCMVTDRNSWNNCNPWQSLEAYD